MKREFLQNLKVGELFLTKDVIDAIMAENGKDIESAKAAGNAWEEKYNQAAQAHRQEVEALRFQQALDTAVHQQGGRNVKAIAALLDLEAIKGQEDIPNALQSALEEMEKTHDYLFERVPAPPLLARGTGTQTGEVHHKSTTLAGALREKYERK